MARTPLYGFHVEHGAKMVDYAGWEMPILYTSIHEEHHAVRTAAGIFDVSHMGRVRFSGRHARRMLERLCTRKVSDMKVGACRYSLVCNEQGGVKDDVIVYRFDDHWLMVCNAANREKLLAHFETVRGDLAVKIDDQTLGTAMVAVQGPRVMEMIGQYSKEVPTLKRYSFAVKNMLVLKMIISRTGYTGEDGVEVILGASMVGMAMKLLMRNNPDGTPMLRACGLGCRDTLRMEAGMPLYGHELDEQTDPFAAGLGFAVSLDKDQDADHGEPERFIGQEALKAIAARGPQKTLVGLKLEGKRTARQHTAVRCGNEAVGEVTSGCLSPTLGYPIAMAYVDSRSVGGGGSLTVDVGGSPVAAEVVPLPFYKRS